MRWLKAGPGLTGAPGTPCWRVGAVVSEQLLSDTQIVNFISDVVDGIYGFLTFLKSGRGSPFPAR